MPLWTHITLHSTLLFQEFALVTILVLFCVPASRYNSSTGVLTVPPGSSGLWYFSIYLLVEYGEDGAFRLLLNDELLCSAYGDHDMLKVDVSTATCSAVVSVEEGGCYILAAFL